MSARELYFISGSPPCWSVMLALAVKGLDYTRRRLSNSAGEQKTPEYRKINPRGHVPVLVDDDTVVTETLAVLSYIDAIHPEPPLFGRTPMETARVWQTISEYDGHLRGPVSDISRPLFRNKVAEFKEQIADAAAKLHDELVLLSERLSASKCLAGTKASAADRIVFPVLMQLNRAAGQENAAALGLAITPLDTNYPMLAAWQARMKAPPGFESAYPPHWKSQAA